MKKFVFTFIALMAVMTVQAQSICGSWQSMQPEVKDLNESYLLLNYIYTFNDDGTFSSVADITYSTKPEQTKEMEMAMSGNVVGTYTLKDNKLTMRFKSNSLQLDVISLSMNGKVVDDPDLLSKIKERIGTVARTKAAESFKDDVYTVKFDSNGSMLELTDKKGSKTERYMRITTLKN